MSELPASQEPLPDDVPPADTLRLYPSTIGGVGYLVVLAAVGVGIFLSWTDDWRLGVKWVGGALVAAGLIRLVLRQRDAGMLSVRRRWVDVLMLTGVGAALIFLTESIPNQPL